MTVAEIPLMPDSSRRFTPTSASISVSAPVCWRRWQLEQAQARRSVRQLMRLCAPSGQVSSSTRCALRRRISRGGSISRWDCAMWVVAS